MKYPKFDIKILKSPKSFIVIIILFLIVIAISYLTLDKFLILFISLATTLWTIFVTHKYAPNARLNLSYKLSANDFIVLIIEVENLSNVRIDKEHVKLQILKYRPTEISKISEWVPFKQDDIIPNEEPIEWSDPIDILKTTEGIYPSERKHVERLIKIPPEDIIFHIGLQVKVALKGFKGKISGIFNWNSMQRTHTIFVIPDRRQALNTESD